MKAVLLFTLISLISISTLAQDSLTDSYTIQRLLIFNDQGEVLLEKHPNGWMTPALRHNSKTSTKQGLMNLAGEFGIQVSAPQLSGIITFISQYKSQSSFRQHYVSTKVGGKLTVPINKVDAKWFSPKKAIEMMSLPDTKIIFAVRDATSHILNNPEFIWGGTYSLYRKNDKTLYKLIEDFYPIGERNRLTDGEPAAGNKSAIHDSPSFESSDHKIQSQIARMRFDVNALVHDAYIFQLIVESYRSKTAMKEEN